MRVLSMASNPYYVKGGGDYGRQLSGISNIVSGVREQKRGQAGKAALQEAYKTRDPEAINRVLVDHPELQEQVSKMDELGRMMRKDNILSIALGADQALNIQDPFERQAFLADRKNEVEARGGNASETDFLIGLPHEEQTQALEGLVEVGRNFAGYGGRQQQKGLSSAKAVIYNDGSVMQTLPDRTTQVTNPSGDIVEGSDRLKTLAAGRKSGVVDAGDKSFARGLGKVTGEEEGSTLSRDDRLKNIRADVKAEDEAGISTKAAEEMATKMFVQDDSINITKSVIAALESGATTGDLARFTPTIQQATKELKHLQNLAGLNVLQTTTFGALSESELKFALDTAIPTNMDSDELKKYMQTKLRGQEKLKALHSKLNRLYNQGLTPSQAIIRLEDEAKAASGGGVQKSAVAQPSSASSQLEALEAELNL